MSDANDSAMAVPLNNTTLDAVPADILRPGYDRSKLTAGIVHIGVGNFHRAHQAWYLHRLMNAGRALGWAILGAGVRPNDMNMREVLASQDFLTTLIELSPEDRVAEVVGSMIGFLPVTEGHADLVEAMADPAIRIVSLTVTEGGYYLQDGAFDATHPDILHDAENPASPRTAFGAMIAALRLRRDAGHGPFTAQSCDNLQGNGNILRDVVVSLARLSDPALADWIDSRCSFPNSMVDSIVPATGPAELALVREMGIEDSAPVTHENFRQWVIQDDFCAGRPDWDQVGATFTADVHPYEDMKIRILNAGHQILANAGELLSVPTISDCMMTPAIRDLFRKVQTEEILPHIASVPGTSPAEYLALVERRFSNPAIRDTTRRVAFDGSSRHAGFLLPTIRDALSAGGTVDGLALVEALWARMCDGRREDGSQIEPNDPKWADLTAAAKAAKDRPNAWLEQTAVYGRVRESEAFTGAFEHWLSVIWRDGTLAAITRYSNDC